MKSLADSIFASIATERVTERVQRISWYPGFSTPAEKEGAARAERLTGLNAREIFRPGCDTNEGLDLSPEPGFAPLRCQLGRIETVTINLPRIEGVRDAVRETVSFFRLIAYGQTWEEAISNFRKP